MRKAFSVLAVAALATVGWATVTITPAASATTTGFVVDTGSTPNQGKLYSLNLSTGAPTEVGQTGKNDIEGLSLDCGGTLFGVNRRPNGEVDANGTASPNVAVDLNQLVTINTTTGLATVVGTLSVEPADAGLTFGTDGKLYMAEVNTGEFYEVNKSTAAVTDIGPMGNSVEITALATRADGTIFGYDRNVGQLVTINPATGASTVVGSSAEVNLIGLDFDASGTLWGVSENGRILTFDPSTGATTDVTTYNNDQNRFVSLAIAPEGCAAPSVPTPEAPAAEAVAAVAQLTG
jgi:hypothetical protein